MISLQSHNQVLFHLTQLTAAVTPRSGALAARVKSRQTSSKDADVVCYESLVEAAKNCTEIPLERISAQNLGTVLRLNKNDAWEALVQSTCGRISRPRSIDPKWRVSYVSGASFTENKRSFPCQQLSEPIVLPAIHFSVKQQYRILRNLSTGAPFSFNLQLRGFKTERNVRSELERNPSMGGRIRKWMGLAPITIQVEKPQVVAPAGEQHDVEKLRGLLNESEMSVDEQQRVKVAFAEGYLAGHGQKSPGRTLKWLKLIQHVITIVIFLAIFVSFMASTNGSIFKIQLGNQVEVDPEEIHVTFNDVKGADEAKQELKDVVEFLRSPEKFSTLGGKLPKGVLLVGPPGTGKTLLARAVAGEAGVPFFHAAGPEFDEILVGQGARRVRDLFKAAKERAPCVIFIDEIDSVGAKRTNSVLHPYANQTINQLLSEMDGFHQNEGVIVLGATNRREDLDKALLRPGRFDVEVNVPTPDYSGRKEILDLYLGRVLSSNVDVDILARGTTGFTGADLENMVNQAALRAAIDGADSVTMKYLENARDKVLMGPERKSRLPDEEANLITAYHEGGHAVVAYYTKDSHPLHKVTIIPRGPSLGHTAYIPEKERYHVTKQQLLAMMDTMMGGRAAEELIFGPEKITSGASSDLKQATNIAVAMVKDWGMSEKVGLRTHDGSSKSLIVVNEVSPNTTELIDNEVKRIMQESYERAKAILKAHAKEHKMLAEALLKYETLDADDIKAVMTGKKTREKPTTTTTTTTTTVDAPKNVM